MFIFILLSGLVRVCLFCVKFHIIGNEILEENKLMEIVIVYKLTTN